MLRNDKDQGVLNGVTCETLSDSINDPEDEDAVYCNILYEGETKMNLPLCRSQFDAYLDSSKADNMDFNKRWLAPADYGYALTVHKSQGSQWEKVLVYDDGFAKREAQTRRKWLYTAITRAQHSLTISF
jgi:exodeoxyribonuclease-5